MIVVIFGWFFVKVSAIFMISAAISWGWLWSTLFLMITQGPAGPGFDWADPFVKIYYCFVGTSVRDGIDAVFSIGNIEWSSVSERVSKRFDMWNISKVAGVFFGRNNLLTFFGL